MNIFAEVKGKAAIIRLKGDLDYESYKELELAVEHAMAQDNTPIALEMSQVPHIDSMGLGTITKYWRIAEQKKQMLCLIGVQKSVREIVNLVNLDKRIRIFDSVEDALQ